MQKQQQAKKSNNKKAKKKKEKEQKQQQKKKQKMANEHFKINAKLLSHDAVCGCRRCRCRRRQLCACASVNVNVNVNSACDARVAVFAITYDIYMLNGQTGAASRCTLVVVCENDRTATKH